MDISNLTNALNLSLSNNEQDRKQSADFILKVINILIIFSGILFKYQQI